MTRYWCDRCGKEMPFVKNKQGGAGTIDTKEKHLGACQLGGGIGVKVVV